MKQDLIKDVIQGMLSYLNNAQCEKLQEVLQYTLARYEVMETEQQESHSEQTKLCRVVSFSKANRRMF